MCNLNDNYNYLVKPFSDLIYERDINSSDFVWKSRLVFIKFLYRLRLLVNSFKFVDRLNISIGKEKTPEAICGAES